MHQKNYGTSMCIFLSIFLKNLLLFHLCAFLMEILRHVCKSIKKLSMERKTFHEVNLKKECGKALGR